VKDVRYLTRGGFGFFMLLVLALHFLKPWLNPLQHSLSEYSVGNFGVLMIVAFFVLGLGFLGLSFQSIQFFSNKTAAYLCSFAFLISAFSSLVLGIFPTIPPGTPSITSALIHNQTAPILLVSSLIGMSMYSLEMRHQKQNRKYFRIAITLVGLAWLSFIMIIVLRTDYPYAGLTQRVFVLCTWLWLALTSLKLT
jgi:hypothetical membrane protein